MTPLLIVDFATLQRQDHGVPNCPVVPVPNALDGLARLYHSFGPGHVRIVAAVGQMTTDRYVPWSWLARNDVFRDLGGLNYDPREGDVRVCEGGTIELVRLCEQLQGTHLICASREVVEKARSIAHRFLFGGNWKELVDLVTTTLIPSYPTLA